jgi:hypothetical protein
LICTKETLNFLQEQGDPAACNTLGNLCVLQVTIYKIINKPLQNYDKNVAACEMYLRLATNFGGEVNNIPEWPKHLPWLYYGTDNQRILKSTEIEQKMAFHAGAQVSVYDV